MSRTRNDKRETRNDRRDMPGPGKRSNRRIIIIQVLIVGWVMIICVRLVSLQVSQHETLSARAERQQQTSIDIYPKRGVIYDRNGNELARSSEVKSLYADPADVTDAEAYAEKLAKILDVDSDLIYKRLASENHDTVVIKRKLTDLEAEKVEALGLRGLRFLPEIKRFYVTGATAAHVLGFVNSEEHGKSGVEQVYDQVICGTGGRLVIDRDALNKSYDHQMEETVPGASVTLTIDTVIQHHVENARSPRPYRSPITGNYRGDASCYGEILWRWRTRPPSIQKRCRNRATSRGVIGRSRPPSNQARSSK